LAAALLAAPVIGGNVGFGDLAVSGPEPHLLFDAVHLAELGRVAPLRHRLRQAHARVLGHQVMCISCAGIAGAAGSGPPVPQLGRRLGLPQVASAARTGDRN